MAEINNHMVNVSYFLCKFAFVTDEANKFKKKTGNFLEVQVLKGLLDLNLDSWEGFRKASGL